jgi:hypothetical protein
MIAFDIATRQSRRASIGAYRGFLLTELAVVQTFQRDMAPADRNKVQGTARALTRIRMAIHAEAMALGYSQRCQAAIPHCRGECCRWHFPKNLDRLDLLLMVTDLSTEGFDALEQQLRRAADNYQCPLLQTDGCLLALKTRPLVCASAYPCFAADRYHRFLKDQQRAIETHYHMLQGLVKG